MTRIYLDNCTFNRPFDNQKRIEIKFEAEAKIHIQDEIRKGRLELVWSYILEFENANNPFPFRREAISEWKKLAKYSIFETRKVITTAVELQKMGLRPKDALHISCAIEAGADYFITTDKAILKRLKNYKSVTVINPVTFLMELEEQQ